MTRRVLYRSLQVVGVVAVLACYAHLLAGCVTRDVPPPPSTALELYATSLGAYNSALVGVLEYTRSPIARPDVVAELDALRAQARDVVDVVEPLLVAGSANDGTLRAAAQALDRLANQLETRVKEVSP